MYSIFFWYTQVSEKQQERPRSSSFKNSSNESLSYKVLMESEVDILFRFHYVNKKKWPLITRE